MPDTHLILHVKGTEQETSTLPKQVVRAAISQGQITHSQLIWVPEDNTWKQVRELPHLLPSQKLAPAPLPRVATGNLPRVATGNLPKVAAVAVPKIAAPKAKTGTVPRIATGTLPKVATPKIQTGPVPRIATASTGAPVVKVAAAVAQPTKSYVVKEEDAGAHPLKWISIILGALILGMVGVNYLLVDRPLVSSLGETPFSQVSVYAHLGAYVQPNVIVIHIPTSSAVTSANLTEFLGALAHSTPTIPMSSNSFARVALTSGWTASYTLTGNDWRQLGDMPNDQRKEFLLSELTDATGEPLMSAQPNQDEATLHAEREKVWNAFVAQFTRS